MAHSDLPFAVGPWTLGAFAMLTDELMREVRRLQLRTKRRVEGLFAGEYHSAFKGRGIEFAEVREYEPGDDVRAIDWNVTARSGKTFIKRFHEERELTVMLVVDLSRSGSFGSSGREKSKVAVEVAAVLALTASMNNDRVGLMIFAEEVELFLPPRKGRTHVLRLLRELLNFEPKGNGTDVSAALERMGQVLHRRALAFVISDFESRPFERVLKVVSRQHEMVAVQVSDPREGDLPNVGLMEISDAETGERMVVDTSSGRTRREYAKLAAEREQERRRLFARARVDRVGVSTDRPFVHDLERYFRMREHRR